MKPLFQNIIWTIAIILTVAFLYSLIFTEQDKPKDIGLNELVVKINQDEIKEIEVKSNALLIVAKNDEKFKTQKETDASITETLKNYGVAPEKLKNINLKIKDESGLTFIFNFILPILLPIIIIGLFFWLTMRQATRGATQAFTFGKSRAKLFKPDKDKITFKDVAALEEAKQELTEIVEFLKSPKKFLDIGAKIPRGVLLMGPPGSGKTYLARAAAGEADVPFFHISGSEFVEMFVGVGSARVRDLFQVAKNTAPCIIFIDEIDAIGRERGTGIGGGHDEREQTLNQILVEMDGFERDTRIIVMAATNRPDILDTALLRPGRFDRRVILDLPDIAGREAILKVHSKNKPIEQTADLRKIAERTPGFSGADLENLVNEAAILTARQNRKIITQNDFYQSVEKVLLGPERKSYMLSEKEKKIAAYHEAGHAIASAFSPGADPVQKISIIARGQAAGYTLKLPEEDRHLKTKTQFLADLTSLLGGYVCEQLVFKELTTGASNDIKEATSLAKALVTKYGMSEKIGPITYGKTEELVFLGKEIAVAKDYSEKVAVEIDTEIKKMISDAYSRAKKILTEQRKKLDEVAELLIKQETIEKEEFEKIIHE